jgi:uroporphyrinogen decarboxylase
MTKIERVDAALSGEECDRAPFLFWYHFGNQYGPGEDFARTVLSFYDHFDIDLLKLMNDYHLPTPPGRDSVKNADDLSAISYVDPEKCDFNEQLKAIEIITDRLDGEAYCIDTVFDPWQQLTKHIVGERIFDVVRDYPEKLKSALQVVADVLIDYGRLAIARGAAGIFFAVQASDEFVTNRELYEEFILPPAMKVLKGIEGEGRFNVLHLCGREIYTGHIPDYPVEVLSWADRLSGNPSIAEMRKQFAGTVLAGIDHTRLNRYSWESIQENVLEGIRLGGKKKFMLAPGCSVVTEMDTHILEKMNDLVKRV